MSFMAAVRMLRKLGLDFEVACRCVQRAKDRGKHIACIVDAEDSAWRTVTIHHGMTGNITHTYTIEIS